MFGIPGVGGGAELDGEHPGLGPAHEHGDLLPRFAGGPQSLAIPALAASRGGSLRALDMRYCMPGHIDISRAWQGILGTTPWRIGVSASVGGSDGRKGSAAWLLFMVMWPWRATVALRSGLRMAGEEERWRRVLEPQARFGGQRQG
jgi:hypothetical protein